MEKINIITITKIEKWKIEEGEVKAKNNIITVQSTIKTTLI